LRRTPVRKFLAQPCLESHGLKLTDEAGNVLSPRDFESLCSHVQKFYQWHGLRGVRLMQKPKSPKATGYVYLLRSESGLFKIGRSVNVTNRLSSIRGGSAEHITLIGALHVPDMAKTESDLHQKFTHRRQRGEWFSLTDSEVREFFFFGGFVFLFPSPDGCGLASGGGHGQRTIPEETRRYLEVETRHTVPDGPLTDADAAILFEDLIQKAMAANV
jgi:hypothetical protein